MRKLLAVLKREYTERIRSKWFLIGSFLAPLFAAAITLLPLLLARHTKPSQAGMFISIIDQTGGDLGRRVVNELAGGITGAAPPIKVETVKPENLPAAESAYTRSVMRGQFTGYLVLDSGTLRGQAVRYAGRNASSIADMDRLEAAVRQAVLVQALQREGLNAGHIQSLVAINPDIKAERITDTGRGGSGTGGIAIGYGIAILLYMMVAIYGQTIMRGVTEEKSSRVAEVILASVDTNTLLAGKVLGVGLVSVTQQLIWAVLAVTFLKLRGPLLEALGAPNLPFDIPHVAFGMWVIFFLFYVLGFIFYASLFAAVGATVTNQEDVQSASTPVVLLLVSSFVFLQPILMNPMSGIAKTMSRLPFSAPIAMPLRMNVVSVSPWEVAASLVGLVIGCAITIRIAAKIYRVGLLMYGKRPGLAEIAQWVRYK
jgi:ABC-2 type transport system permease protein